MLQPTEHKKDRRHKSEPQWVEISFGHIVLRFIKKGCGIEEKQPRKNLEPKKYRGRSATYIHDSHSYTKCCEMARRILCPDRYTHWLEKVEDRQPIIERPPTTPKPTEEPQPNPFKGSSQGSLF